MTTPPIITDDMPERVRLDPDHNGYETQVIGFADGMEDTEDWPLYVRADLSRPRVKLLEWIAVATGYEADSLVGEYEVQKFGEYWRWINWGPYRSSDYVFESSDDAKSAADEDYTRRILSALEG